MTLDSTNYVPYYKDNDNELLAMMQDAWEQNNDQWQEFQYQGDIDSRILAGDQDAMYNYIANTYNYRQRGQFTSNKIQTIMNMISGHQRRNRKTTIALPREPNDQDPADQLSKLLMYTSRQANAYENISTAFTGGLTTGLNLIHTYLDYTSDPINGDIMTSVVPYNAIQMDPFFKDMSLKDCKFIWTRKYPTKEEAKRLLPGREKEIDALSPQVTLDGKFPFMPENFNFERADRLTYNEFWYASSRKQEVLLDQNTGETHNWEGDDESLELFLDLYPQIKKINQTIPTVKLGIVLNGRVFYHGPNIYGIDSYPFVPVVGYFHPEIEYMKYRIYGVVRNLRDLQWAYNRRMRIQLDLLESQVSSGLKVLEDSLIDPNDAFLQGPGRVMWIKKEAGMDAVQPFIPPQIPPSWFQETEWINSDMKEVSGVTEELLGASDTDTGITQMLRQGAGLTTLQPLYDKLDESQKNLGNLFLELIRNNYELGKIQRILGEEPNPLVKNKYFHKFDIAITEGMLTETQQKMQFNQLLQMQQLGIPIPADILIKSAPLQDKKDLIESIQNEKQAAQEQQQQQMQVQMEVLKAQIEDLKAKATANVGLGLERVARIDENKALAVERLAEAKKDTELGTLHFVQALKELEGMDLTHLGQTLAIIKEAQAISAAQDVGTARTSAAQITEEPGKEVVKEESIGS